MIKNYLEDLGISTSGKQYLNISREKLLKMAIEREEGILSKQGAFCVETGKYTGRIAQDKYTVAYPNTEAEIWYNDNNKKIDESTSHAILEKIKKHYSNKDLFIRNCFVGADKEHRIVVRLISETAWHNAFGSNMFIDFPENKSNLPEHDLVIYHAPSLELNASEVGTRSEAFVISDLQKKVVMIGGTHYAGEIKKAIFSYINYIFPQKGVMSMHASANVGASGDSVIFFGLSGTGKTTLSSEKSRLLIGDDEHGWSDDGIFNIEGGCYAKMIRISKETEPEIYSAWKEPEKYREVALKLKQMFRDNFKQYEEQVPTDVIEAGF